MTGKSILNKHPRMRMLKLKIRIRIRGCAKSDIRPIPTKKILEMRAIHLLGLNSCVKNMKTSLYKCTIINQVKTC